MNCSQNEYVCSVSKENNSGCYRLHTIWGKDGFFINVTSRNGSWRGEMTPSDVAKISAQLELEPEFYMNQCKKALTCHGGQPGVVYAVEDGCFTWKRVEDEDSGIKIKMGSVMLEPTNFIDAVQDLITAALNCNQKLQEKLNEISKEKITLLENRNEVLDKLNGLIKAKETMETDLYAKFILLINAKKRKICELENLFEEKCKTEKGISENLNNPYEIDTDTESDEVGTVNNISEGEKTSCKSIPKNVRNSHVVHQDTPKEKKAKNEDFTSEKVDLYLNSDRVMFPEPSTSRKETISQGVAADKIALTKDQLYDYFYGNS